jgi:NAD(P)-dependent dehydrogenase (short-subunit alcohol dehydrogenase family)
MSPRPDDSDKVAVVTGASRGLGRALARSLAQQRYRLILTARGEEALNGAATEFRGDGSAVIAIGGDVTDPAHRRRILEAANDWGRIDVLVNNASEIGTSPMPPLAESSRENLLRVFDVNVLAPLALVQEALPLLESAHGLVVNISSDAAVGGYPGWGTYGASKAALDLVSKTLAAELKDRGVAVVSVDPGDMRTAMHQAAYPGQDISNRPLPEVTLPFWAWLLSQDPMKITGGRYQAQASVWEVPA